MIKIVIDVILFTVLSISLYTDLKSAKIYNIFTLPTIIAGILLNMLNNPTSIWVEGFLNSFYGISIAFVFFIIPFLFGMIGGGDVKLLMAVGALKGYVFFIYALLSIAFVSFFLSLMVFLVEYLKNFKLIGLINLLAMYFNKNVMVDNDEIKPILKKNLKFGISIFLGTLIAYVYLRLK